MTTLTPLAVYLRNHEAAAQAGSDLFRRVASSHRRQPYAAEIKQLAAEVQTDLRSLRDIMARHDVSPDPKLAVLLRVGERAGRLKPNGSLLRRSPLTDLVEIEGLLDAVRAKSAGWLALAAAGSAPETDEFEILLQRADEQIAVLTGIHHQLAARVLDLA